MLGPSSARTANSGRARSSASGLKPGAHQDESRLCITTPMRIADAVDSPVLKGTPADQAVVVSCDSQRPRISALRSKPPDATITPRAARMRWGSPSPVTIAPVTRPSSTMNSVGDVERCTGTPCCLSATIRRATSAPPPVRRRSRGVFQRWPTSSQYWSAIRRNVDFAPWPCVISGSASRAVQLMRPKAVVHRCGGCSAAKSRPSTSAFTGSAWQLRQPGLPPGSSGW